MCRRTDDAEADIDKAIKRSTASKRSGSMNKIALYLSMMVAAFAVILPLIISEATGGWTNKYTSPGPVFTASDIGDLTGKVAIVTGSNTGIGYHTALELARNGAEVIVAARSRGKGEAAAARIVREAKLDNADSVVYMPLDLSSLKSVKSFASDFLKLKKPLHILVNNAGVMKSPGAQYVGKNLTYGFEITADGFESHIGINHVGHFYLTQLLTKKLKASAPSRVVAVSSGAESGSYPEGMRFDLWRPDGQRGDEYEDGKAYGQSKLANLMFIRELAARLEGTGVSAYSCHPGVIVSELDRYMAKEFEKDIDSKALPERLALKAASAIFGNLFKMAQFKTKDGALTQLQLATADSSKLTTGAFYHPIGRVVQSGHAQGSNTTLQKLLWEQTENVLRKAV